MRRPKAGRLVFTFTFLIIAGLFTNFAQAANAKTILPFKKFGLLWKTKLPEEIILLRVWYTLDDGQTWKLYSETENPSSPAPVKVKEDGVYGLYSQAKDISGLEEPSPTPGTRPKKIVIIDTKKPALVLVQPNTADVFPTGQDMRIEWNADDVNFGKKPINLYYSVDGGGTWSVIQKDLPNTGSYVWKLPNESSQLYKVKIVAVDLAGNSEQDTSDNNFIVDGQPPVSRITGPKSAKSPNFNVTYNVRDLGGAGVAKVTLYFQVGKSKNWHMYGEDRDLKSPIHFEAKTGGQYGFKIVATDRVGNSEASPDASTRPDLVCLMDSVEPMVKLLNFKGGSIKPAGGGKVRPIKWEASDDNMAANPITIEYTVDNGEKWNVIVANYKNSGNYPWVIPSRMNVSQARIRIIALDVLGNKGRDISNVFRIDGTAPETEIKIVKWEETPNQGAADPGPMRKATVVPQKSVTELITSISSALNDNDLHAAQADLNTALRQDDNSYMLHYLQGRVHYENSRLEDAVKSLKRSVQINSNFQDSHINLGICYQDLGLKSLKQLRDAEMTKNYFRKAALQYEEAVKIKPDTWLEFFNLGYIHAHLSNYNQALSNFQKAVPLSRDNGNAFWFMGQVYEKQNKLRQAIEMYTKAQGAYSSDTEFRQKAEFKVRELKDRMSRNK